MDSPPPTDARIAAAEPAPRQTAIAHSAVAAWLGLVAVALPASQEALAVGVALGGWLALVLTHAPVRGVPRLRGEPARDPAVGLPVSFDDAVWEHRSIARYTTL